MKKRKRLTKEEKATERVEKTEELLAQGNCVYTKKFSATPNP